MSEYYAIVRSGGDHLTHYGIKGMKWGVRKAIDRGTYRALQRQYHKASKKLAKLQNRANIDHQKNIVRAAKHDQKLASIVGGASIGISAGKGIASVANAVKQARKTGFGVASIPLPIGAGVAAGAIAANAIRKKIAKNRMSEKGHAKAVKEANDFKKEMRKAFKGTYYDDEHLFRNTRIAAATKRGRTISQLSRKDRIAFEKNYAIGSNRGMTHVQAERYANRILNGDSTKNKKHR